MTRDVPWLRFLTGFVVLWAALYMLGGTGSTSIDHGVVSALVIVALAIAIESRLLRTPRAEAPVRLGLGNPGTRAMVAGLVVSLAVVAVLPVYPQVTGEQVQLRSGWPWLAVGLLAYHGVAEELCWRGYVFGHLRRGRRFAAAVVATMPLIALTHVPVALESGLAVGLVAVVIAIVTCIPLAHLYELGHRTIWPGALVHAAIDAFALLDQPAGPSGLPLAIVAAALVCPFLAFAWRNPSRAAARAAAAPCDVTAPRGR